MLTIKTPAQVEAMAKAGAIVASTLALLGDMAKPGVSTDELEKAAVAHIRHLGAKPTFLNYQGYPKGICVSVNEQVVHGIPGSSRLKNGDIVSCDVGAEIDGWQGDAARTFLVGDVPDEVRELVEVTRECFFEGMKYARPGFHISDISRAIQEHAESHGYGVVRELVGHGIGREMHEPPDVPNYVLPHHGRGLRLIPGLTIAVEPMINLGTAKVYSLKDGWTVVTADGRPSAHYENTLAITDGEPRLLTVCEGGTP